MKDHNIPITNRKGSKELDNGNYNVISVIADIIMILLIQLRWKLLRVLIFVILK